ncbi:phage regulatory CII family protein [Metapseudomonas otitidis]|uniref:phage regulatory CII family protein n=1 Tax=Metapseudomonas otitidis TaxID=319939 RepID=UPI00366C32B2
MEYFEKTLHDEVIAEGGTDLAKRMGVNRTRLLDCANPNREEHRMNMQMFGQILAHLSAEARKRVLSALVGEYGYDVVCREAPPAQNLQAAVLHMHAEIADVTKAVTDALADGHVSQIEKQQIKRHIGEASAALEVLRESVKVA